MLLESLLEGFQRQVSPILESSEVDEATLRMELERFLGLTQDRVVIHTRTITFYSRILWTRCIL